jgi:hypothetical protein
VGKRKITEKFLASVKRNLPSPEDSGPRTEEGKKKVATNALKHGLYAKGILACKASCYYRDLCVIYDQIFDDNPDHIGVCIWEATDFLALLEDCKQSDYIDEKQIKQIIELTLIADRTNRCIALDSDIRSADKHTQKAIELHARVQKKTVKMYKELLEENKEEQGD